MKTRKMKGVKHWQIIIVVVQIIVLIASITFLSLLKLFPSFFQDADKNTVLKPVLISFSYLIIGSLLSLMTWAEKSDVETKILKDKPNNKYKIITIIFFTCWFIELVAMVMSLMIAMGVKELSYNDFVGPRMW